MDTGNHKLSALRYKPAGSSAIGALLSANFVFESTNPLRDELESALQRYVVVGAIYDSSSTHFCGRCEGLLDRCTVDNGFGEVLSGASLYGGRGN